MAMTNDSLPPEATSAARLAAGWSFTDGTWLSPCGMDTSDWMAESWPFPEDADYAAWALAAYHYEALDHDIDLDSPWPTTTSPAPRPS